MEIRLTTKPTIALAAILYIYTYIYILHFAISNYLSPVNLWWLCNNKKGQKKALLYPKGSAVTFYSL